MYSEVEIKIPKLIYSEVQIKIPKLSKGGVGRVLRYLHRSGNYSHYTAICIEWELQSLYSYLHRSGNYSHYTAICIEVGTESLAIDSEEGLRVPTYTLPNQGELRVASCPQ